MPGDSPDFRDTRGSPCRPALRILLADDSATVRAAIGRILLLLGYEVDSVRDGAEALAALRRAPYDAALLDVQMPVMGGPEAASRFRRGARGSKPPYLIAISADDSPPERRRCSESGMDEFLAKPILAAQLARVLDGLACPVAARATV
jgi:CheY-like chemotaxis protein